MRSRKLILLFLLVSLVFGAAGTAQVGGHTPPPTIKGRGVGQLPPQGHHHGGATGGPVK